MVEIKRVYDPPSKDDGYIVLVDRLWPRGIKKDDLRYDEWLKEIAPSTELRKALHRETIDFAHFAQQYRQELQHSAPLAELKIRAQKQKVTLLTAAKLDQQNHITVLMTLLS
ncbi:DUF488 family protein [Yersinia aleksiciae]|uniref:DUF488 domain-containing protein n=1 Tax=Yersinia aleksiciae TaxID=263819 RepID=UPI0011A50D45|nr:DUF488 family protein [Yersinia aleksiciae]MDN0124327.1 DUF488 family protein [Yersinia aleksiciae]